MSLLKGKQIKDSTLDLNKLRSGSKILPNTAKLGTAKTVEQITDIQEYINKGYIDAKIDDNLETIIATSGVLSNLNALSSTVQFTSTSSVSLTGITNVRSGKGMLLINKTPFDLTLMHLNASSTAANQLFIQGEENVNIRPNGAATFRYSTNQSKWMMVSIWGADYFPTLKGERTRTVEVTPTGYAQAVENIELNTWVLNQTVEFSKESLNIAFPTYFKGQRVICPNITTGGMIYEKYDDSTHDWFSYGMNIAPTSNGQVTYTPIYITDTSVKTLLENISNWNNNGNYTGATATGKVGQKHYDEVYFYECVNTNTWIRMQRI
jgi:hypothetical protein